MVPTWNQLPTLKMVTTHKMVQTSKLVATLKLLLTSKCVPTSECSPALKLVHTLKCVPTSKLVLTSKLIPTHSWSLNHWFYKKCCILSKEMWRPNQYGPKLAPLMTTAEELNPFWWLCGMQRNLFPRKGLTWCCCQTCKKSGTWGPSSRTFLEGIRTFFRNKRF